MRFVFLISLFYFSSIVHSQSGNGFFIPEAVHSIHIQFSEPNYFDSLSFYKEQGDITGIEKYLSAEVIIDEDTINNVGIRFRGNSSYNHPGTKKPVQLDFNEFVSGQKYDGMKKLNLNNGYLDPTQIREKLFMDIMRESGIATPRVTFTKVYFNGEYIGLYKAMETINKEFLEDNFGNNDGNLFKCEPNTPLSWEGPDQNAYSDNAELKTNETENDWSDLVNLIYTINFSGSNFENNLRTKFNLDSYIKSWAMNNVFGNLDSYVYLPHNYYLYHDTITDKFEWITWDVSLAFGVYALLVVPNSIDFDILYLPNDAKNTRPLNYHILNDENLKQQYMGEVCHFLKNEFLPTKLFPKIDSLGYLIRPYLEMEPSANRMFSIEEFESNLEYKTISYQLLGQVPGLKDFIIRRRKSITGQLCDNNWSCFLNQEISDEEVLNIYPNPGNEIKIQFIAPNEFHTSEFLITDMSGKKIRQWTHQNMAGIQEINLKNMESGMYILKLESGCKSTAKKFVVVK